MKESTMSLDGGKESVSSHVPGSAGNRASQHISQWNTDRLGKRLAVDAASAGIAAAAISPVITIIDQAIIEKAAKGLAITDSLKTSAKRMLLRPQNFFASAPFLLIYTLYSSTYVTANAIDTLSTMFSSENGSGGFGAVTAGPVKFLATTAVNMSTCVYKDSRFAKFFGNHSAPAPKVNAAPKVAAGTRVAAKIPPANIAHAPVQHPPMPRSSLALFCVRDSLTIFASFNLPPLLAPSIPDWVAPSAVAKSNLAQFLIPSAVQLVSTPIHLLGLDLYNRPHLPAHVSSGATVPVPASDRWQRVSRDWMPSFAARVARIAPAFGVGGVLNARARAKMMEMVEGKE